MSNDGLDGQTWPFRTDVPVTISFSSGLNVQSVLGRERRGEGVRERGEGEGGGEGRERGGGERGEGRGGRGERDQTCFL